MLLRGLLKLVPPFNFSSDDVDEIAATSLLWLPFVVFVLSRLWLARRRIQMMQKCALDIFFGTHLFLWSLAKASADSHQVVNIFCFQHFQQLTSSAVSLLNIHYVCSCQASSFHGAPLTPTH
jgi:hypothetical protein